MDALTLNRGYYRNSPLTTRIRECPQFIGCRGGNVTDEYCATGYESALCATCEPGYFMSSWKTCERCESSEKWVHMAMSFSLVAVLVAVAFIIRQKQFATLWEFIWTSMQSQVKILWSTLQILSQFSVLLEFHMPPVLSEFYGALDVSQFNPLSGTPRLLCSFRLWSRCADFPLVVRCMFSHAPPKRLCLEFILIVPVPFFQPSHCRARAGVSHAFCPNCSL